MFEICIHAYRKKAKTAFVMALMVFYQAEILEHLNVGFFPLVFAQ